MKDKYDTQDILGTEKKTQAMASNPVASPVDGSNASDATEHSTAPITMIDAHLIQDFEVRQPPPVTNASLYTRGCLTNLTGRFQSYRHGFGNWRDEQ
jgi:hypothetical protein